MSMLHRDLIEATKQNNLDKVVDIFCNNLDVDIVNIPDQYNKTALIYAVENNNLNLVKELLNYDLNVDQYYQLALSKSSGDVKELLSLVNKGSSIDDLILAVKSGYLSFLKHWNQRNGSVNQYINFQDEDGNTIVHHSSKSNNPMLIEYLLSFNPDLSLLNKEGFFGVRSIELILNIKELYISEDLCWKRLHDKLISIDEYKGSMTDTNKMILQEFEEKKLAKEKYERLIATNFEGNSCKLPTGRLVVKEKLGQGTSGVVYAGLFSPNDSLDQEEVIVKYFPGGNWYVESSNYKMLERNTNIGNHYPKLYVSSGDISLVTEYQFIVYKKYYKTLNQLIEMMALVNNETLVIDIMKQLINIVYELDKKKLAITDISPDNFMVSKAYSDDKNVRLVDLGAITRTNFGLDYDSWAVTPKYASIGWHQRNKHSLYDELEAIGYMAAHLITGGKLPWEKITKDTGNYDNILQLKQLPGDQIVNGASNKIVRYLDYIKSDLSNKTKEQVRSDIESILS